MSRGVRSGDGGARRPCWQCFALVRLMCKRGLLKHVLCCSCIVLNMGLLCTFGLACLPWAAQPPLPCFWVAAGVVGVVVQEFGEKGGGRGARCATLTPYPGRRVQGLIRARCSVSGAAETPPPLIEPWGWGYPALCSGRCIASAFSQGDNPK